MYYSLSWFQLLPTEAPLEPEEDDNTDESEVEQVAESEVTIETEVKTAVGKATSSTLAKESHKSRYDTVADNSQTSSRIYMTSRCVDLYCHCRCAVAVCCHLANRLALTVGENERIIANYITDFHKLYNHL